MVSLKDRKELYAECKDEACLLAFVQWMLDDTITIHADDNRQNTQDIARNAIIAIKNNSKTGFHIVYESIARRKPRKDTVWIYDDILMFTLVIGAIKFEIDAKPLNAILNVRKQSQDNEKRILTDLLEDALSGQIEVAGKYRFVSICIADVIGTDYTIEQSTANTIYQEALGYYQDSKSNLFIRVCALRACDIIVTLKDLLPPGRVKSVIAFSRKFQSRVSQIATFVYVVVVVLLLAYIIYRIVQQPDFSITQWRQYLGDTANILGVLGWGGIAAAKKYVEAGVSWIIYRIFGVKKLTTISM